MKNVWLGVTALTLVLGCGSAPAPVTNAPAKTAMVDPVEQATEPAEVEESAEEVRSKRLIAEMLDKVARARGLPIKRPVPSKVLTREALGQRIRDMVGEETPKEVLVAQGELLAALELVPPEYDFLSGALALLGGRVAGFYDPKEAMMVLAGDLGEAEATETLAHELAHALADQSFPLAPHIKYKPGEGDRSSAVHAFIEGDATSTMLDVTLGSAFEMNEDALRVAFVASTLLSEVGARTPRASNSSLVAPYVDGFVCVQALRRRGDWPAVDEVWRRLPETTEQLLHIDKLLAREPAEVITTPSLGALEKDGYRPVVEDVMGEQGLRILLEDVAVRKVATEAAAGLGGDKVVVAERTYQGKRQVAVAYRLRMDTAFDAAEVAVQSARKYGKTCRERESLGPVAWEMKGRDILLVAGPYERQNKESRSIDRVAALKAWLSAAWKAAPASDVVGQRAER
ncbi:MAG: hypothetical protein IPM54_15895 [Polyangiaceae bacterium]|nr:hypothetical protein [Polyangiaceae bacterium]